MKEQCYICNAEPVQINVKESSSICECPRCGRYIIDDLEITTEDKVSKSYDKHKLISYLFYNKQDNIAYFIGSRERYEEYIDRVKPRYDLRLLTPKMVDRWFPDTQEKKIEYILSKIFSQTTTPGDIVHYEIGNIEPLLFFNSYDKPNNEYTGDLKRLINFYKKYFVDKKLVELFDDNCTYISIELSATAIDNIEKIKKENGTKPLVFLAMKFGEETDDLLDALYDLLEKQMPYKAIRMDRHQHNNMIVPEMFELIGKSKFVIADLSDGNNGAYYEAGYARGLGKEVIHICRSNVFDEVGLHFDVKQINTIKYDDYEKLQVDLKKRIEETIN